jgi:hypothetical protein
MSQPDPGRALELLAGNERLRPFVKGGRITGLPAKRARRLLLLEQIAQAFEPGVRYPEPQVNAALRTLFDDHAALRRYLVDEGYMSRESGVYWRTGGDVGVPA